MARDEREIPDTIHISEIEEIHNGYPSFRDEVLFVRVGNRKYKIKNYHLLQAFQNGWTTFRPVLKIYWYHLEPIKI